MCTFQNLSPENTSLKCNTVLITFISCFTEMSILWLYGISCIDIFINNLILLPRVDFAFGIV